MVRRLDSCGLGLFLGHAFGDEGAGGGGGRGVSYWVGRRKVGRDWGRTWK